MASGTIRSKRWTSVWTNTSTSTSFAAQTVQIDLSSYTEVMIKFARADSDPTKGVFYFYARVGDYLYAFYSFYLSGFKSRQRSATIASTGITFTQAEDNGSANNTYLVPLEIFAR